MQRIVFMGSPQAAVPSLRALAEPASDPHRGPFQVAGVITQSAKAQGRHRHVQPSAVAAEATRLGLPVLTPDSLKDAGAQGELQGWQPDLIVVCAYGQLLPREVLELPPRGCYNLHFSLLPRWRGASPVQAALLAGDAATGVSVQRMVQALDAGPLAGCTPPLPILPQDTAGSLTGRLAAEGARLLLELLPKMLSGAVELQPQDEALAIYCRKIDKAAGAVDCRSESAEGLLRKLRAFDPWPGCHAYLGPLRLGLERAEAVPPGRPPGRPPGPADAPALPAGRIGPDGLLALGQGRVRLLQVRPQGKGSMSWQAFARGRPGAVGAVLTREPAP